MLFRSFLLCCLLLIESNVVNRIPNPVDIVSDLQVRHTSMMQQTAMDVSCVDPADHYGSEHCGYSVSHALQVKKKQVYT
ncbi:hypothetical protein Hanom_Chr09g00849761 [Helianthus anomalus]